MITAEWVWLTVGILIGGILTERIFHITTHPRTTAREKRRKTNA